MEENDFYDYLLLLFLEKIAYNAMIFSQPMNQRRHSTSLLAWVRLYLDCILLPKLQRTHGTTVDRRKITFINGVGEHHFRSSAVERSILTVHSPLSIRRNHE
jgi:hypothetical protein